MHHTELTDHRFKELARKQPIRRGARLLRKEQQCSRLLPWLPAESGGKSNLPWPIISHGPTATSSEIAIELISGLRAPQKATIGEEGGSGLITVRERDDKVGVVDRGLTWEESNAGPGPPLVALPRALSELHTVKLSEAHSAGSRFATRRVQPSEPTGLLT